MEAMDCVNFLIESVLKIDFDKVEKSGREKPSFKGGSNRTPPIGLNQGMSKIKQDTFKN